MRSSLDTIFDVLLLVLVLAFSLPIFLFLFYDLQYNSNFGFGTLKEKSVIVTSAQEKELYGSQYLEDKKLLTNAHIVMLSLVDDKEATSELRTVRIYWEEPEKELSYNYSLTESSKQRKGALIGNGLAFMQVLFSEGLPNNYKRGYYHVSILQDGSLVLSEKRKEVE